MNFGPPSEIFGVDGIIILVVVVLVLFGSTQIPKLARSLGSAQKEFKKGLDEGAEDGKSTATAVSAPPVVVQAPPSVAAPVVQAPPASAPPAPTVVVDANGDGQTRSAS